MGLAARQDELFLVPSETRGSKVLGRAHALANCHQALTAPAEQLVLEDARVRDLHLALLADCPAPPGDPARLSMLRACAARRETAGFSRDDWALLLSDSESLKALP